MAMDEERCYKCKYWIRLETGCWYGTCLLNLEGRLRFEDENCENFTKKVVELETK